MDNNIPHQERLAAHNLIGKFDGYILAIGWRWMLPANQSVIVIHDSLLPKYRGFAPLVNSLINGETEIGATAFFAGEEYDNGKIIIQASKNISYPIKISDAIELMAHAYIQLVKNLFDLIKTGEKIESNLQNEELATYSLWRDLKDYMIDWTKSADEIVRFVDAVGTPYLGARCLVNGQKAIVHSASVLPDLNIADRQSSLGKVLFVKNENPVVVCTKGLISIHQLTTEQGENLLPLVKFRTRFSS